MKNVVAEALRGKTAPKKGNHNLAEPASSPKLNTLNQQPISLDHINRPNYQHKNVNKRLSVLNRPSESLPVSNSKASETIADSTSFSETTISNLRKLSLSQGKTETATARVQQLAPAQEKSQYLGSTKDGTSIWFFPTVHPQLANRFQRSTSGCSVVVVRANSCYPSQLLLLNDLLHSNSDLKYHLIWSKGNNQPFTLELYDPETNRLEKIAKDIFQHFNKRSLKNMSTYHITSPSAWLSKQLGLTKSEESAGMIEGISYHHSLLLLDHFLKSGQELPVSFQMDDHYLLLTGKSKDISETLTLLKKLADRL
jgi:hypothetical protein